MIISSSFKTNVYLGVEDKIRHYAYFGTKPTASIHISSGGHGGGYVLKEICINDGRNNKSLTLDDASFELVDCPTSLSTQDFYDLQSGGNAELTQTYYKEVADLVKAKIGCDHVICFHHQVRNQDKQGSSGGVAPYATGFPHTDSSPVSGDELALSMAPDGGKFRRYLYLNLWRNICDTPIENDHLALLDERTTVKPDDYIAKDLFGEGYSVVQYDLNARHADNHKWYYYPKMKKDEAILFKQLDSDWTKTGRICFHTSVNNPEVTNYASRESIEVRMVCYWNEKADLPNSMPTEENMNVKLIKDPRAYAEGLSAASFTLNPFKIVKGLFLQLFRLLTGKALGGGTNPEYSGNPEDYVAQCVNSVNAWPHWPEVAKTWARGVMVKHKKVEDGIAEITWAMVDDQGNHQKMKAFKRSEKKEILDHLMNNEKYMKAAMKIFGEL